MAKIITTYPYVFYSFTNIKECQIKKTFWKILRKYLMMEKDVNKYFEIVVFSNSCVIKRHIVRMEVKMLLV